MDTWFLGYCTNCPDGTRTGRIAPIVSLRRNSEGEYVPDRPIHDFDDEFGPSGYVFWPQTPRPAQDVFRCAVRFRCIRSPEHGDSATNKDWMKVAQEQREWEVYRLGYRIFDQSPSIHWRHEPRWVIGLPEGERLFIRLRAENRIVGPWRVGREYPSVERARELIPHPTPNSVYSYSLRSLDEIVYPIRFSDRLLQEILLYLPDEDTGEPVDLATPKQLAKWLVERVTSTAPQIISRLDKEELGWRNRIREAIEASSDHERRLNRVRWDRLEEILKDLRFEADEVAKLFDHPRFVTQVSSLTDAQVQARVAARTAEIESEAQRKSKATVASAEKLIAEVEQRHQAAKIRLEQASKELDGKLAKSAEREAKINSLIAHLNESRERLVKDLALYQGLLPRTAAVSEKSSVTVPMPRVDEDPTQVNGPPIQLPVIFVNNRLRSALNRWHRGLPRIIAQMLHAAVCGTKATLVPSPAWARSYVEALGGTARFTSVNVQPTWLGFDDLWKGGLAECWERASQSTTAIELVLLRDFNRALPQCYARPLLDLIAGYVDRLPVPNSRSWPINLRIFACPSPPDESLPLTVEVIQHFAAIQKALPSASAERVEDESIGHVPAETWLKWCVPAPGAEPSVELANRFGSLARSTAGEIATIFRILKDLGMNEREAKQTSQDLRVEDAMQYLGAKE